MSIKRGGIVRTFVDAVTLQSNAELPYKLQPSDVAYTVTLISRADNRSEDDTGDVNLFHTGVVITPPSDHYAEIIASPSLWRHGYNMPAPIIVNPGNKSELIIPLFKFKDSEDIELPFQAVQMIVRKIEPFHLKSTANESSYAASSSGSQRSATYAPDFDDSGSKRHAKGKTSTHMW